MTDTNSACFIVYRRLVQGARNSFVYALRLRLYCTNPSISTSAINPIYTVSSWIASLYLFIMSTPAYLEDAIVARALFTNMA